MLLRDGLEAANIEAGQQLGVLAGLRVSVCGPGQSWSEAASASRAATYLNAAKSKAIFLALGRGAENGERNPRAKDFAPVSRRAVREKHSAVAVEIGRRCSEGCVCANGVTVLEVYEVPLRHLIANDELFTSAKNSCSPAAFDARKCTLDRARVGNSMGKG